MLSPTIIGAGKIGKEIATRLINEGHDLIIIDKNESKLQRIEEQYDCLCIRGSGSNATILSSSVVMESKLLIAVTNSDEVNMIACMTARRLGIPRTIARIRDPDHSKNLIISKEDLGIDLIINPNYSAAMEISRFLTLNFPVHIEQFARGKVQLADIAVDENTTMFVTKKLMDQLAIVGHVRIPALSNFRNNSKLHRCVF